MNIEQIEARMAELEAMMTADGADLDAIEAETNSLAEQRKAIETAAAAEAEQRKAVANKEIGTTIKNVTEEKHMPTIAEIRSSNEYAAAYLKAIKGDDTEARALLSTNAVAGNIPVPTFLETEIKNAWEKCAVASLCKHSYLPGNVKVGFELSATGAVVHVEGAAAPEEEVITIGVVELKAESMKKWITVSDEAIEGTTVDTIGYLYAEIAQKIVELAEETMIGKIVNAPTTSSATACAVPKLTAAVAEDTIVNAEALLSGKATNLHIVMNRQTYAAFMGVILKGKYALDAFDGLRDRVVFTDKLPAYSAAGSGDVYAIVGDFGYGAQMNFPSGNEMTIKMDDLSLAEKDLVKLVGRQYVGMGVVAPKAFVNIAKA